MASDGWKVGRLRGGYPEVLSSVKLVVVSREGVITELDSRVWDLEPRDAVPNRITVSWPEAPDGTEVEPPGPAERVVLAWLHPTGLMQVPVVVEPHRRRYGPVWLATPQGPVTRLQRREFVRARVALPAQVTPVAEEGEDVADDAEAPDPLPSATGIAVDVSEGGVQVMVRGTLPEPGAEVEVALRVDGETMVLPSLVLRRISYPRGGDGLALQFADPDRYGDRIRALVFAEERRLAAREH